MDSITLRNMEFSCHIGTTAEERSVKQPILVEVVLFGDFSKAAQTDNLADTADYSQFYQQLVPLMESNTCHLIETLAEKIATCALQFPIQQVTVKLSKPQALPGKAFPLLTITRQK